MAHHAYVYIGSEAAGTEAALGFSERELGLSRQANPDIAQFSFGLFSVADARRVGDVAMQAPMQGQQKLIIISVARLFHEAQNALLKLFEEPPQGTTLILIIPAEGMLLPTLRSRLVSLPQARTDLGGRSSLDLSEEAEEFLAADQTGREKFVTKLLLRTKSDKDAEKQAGRLSAIRLLEGITHAAYAKSRENPSEESRLLLYDLDRFMPILHERSAPLKLIFEHLLLVIPRDLHAPS